jgi:hypothetical protein
LSTVIWLLNIKNRLVLSKTLKSYISRRSQDRTKRYGKNDSVEIIGHTYFFTTTGYCRTHITTSYSNGQLRFLQISAHNVAGFRLTHRLILQQFEPTNGLSRLNLQDHNITDELARASGMEPHTFLDTIC